MVVECSDIILHQSIYFIEMFSRYLLFFIFFCSFIVPMGLGSGSNVSFDTPKFLGLDLRECRRKYHYFYFSVISSG